MARLLSNGKIFIYAVTMAAALNFSGCAFSKSGINDSDSTASHAVSGATLNGFCAAEKCTVDFTEQRQTVYGTTPDTIREILTVNGKIDIILQDNKYTARISALTVSKNNNGEIYTFVAGSGSSNHESGGDVAFSSVLNKPVTFNVNNRGEIDNMSGYEAFLVDITDSESNISGEISGSAQKALQDILSESEIKNLLFRAVGNIPYDDDPITEYSYTYSTSSLYPLIYDEKCTYSGSEGSSHKINISSAIRAGADNPSLNTDEQYALTGSAVGKFIINGSGNILRSFDITESLTGVYVTVRDGATVKTSVTRSTYKEITVSRG